MSLASPQPAPAGRPHLRTDPVAWGLVGLVLLRPVVDLLWMLPGPWLAAYGALCTVAVVALAVRLRHTLRHDPLTPAFLVFAVVAAVGAARAHDSLAAADGLARALGPPLLLLVLPALAGPAHRRALWLGLPLVALPGLVAGAVALAAGQPASDLRAGLPRLSGAHSDPHNLALFMALVALVGLSLVLRGGRLRLPAALLTLACSLLLLATWVRTAMLGLAVGALVLLLLQRRFRAAGAGLALGALALLASPNLRDRFADLPALVLGTAENPSSLGSGRIAFWTRGVQHWITREPIDVLLGMGLHEHRLLHFRGIDVHNDLLAVLFQLGPAGLASWLALLLLAGVGIHRAARVAPTEQRLLAHLALALLAMFLVGAAVSNAAFGRPHLGWVLLALVAAARPVTTRGAAAEAATGRAARSTAGPPQP